MENESITNLETKIWDLIPQNIKEENFLSSFKNKMKMWIPNNCPCFFEKHTIEIPLKVCFPSAILANLIIQ